MSIFDPFGEREARIIAQNKRYPKGLAVEQMVPGALVVCSPNLTTGDRSYLDSIWEVKFVTGGRLLLKIKRGHSWMKNGEWLAVYAEHYWYPAEDLINEMAPETEPPSADS
jgi:hypothetical protein